jgi:polar amino acid transport system permease protein
MNPFWQNLRFAPGVLIHPLLLTIIGAILAGALAMMIAIPVAFARLSKVTLLRNVATFYVETIRGTPLLLQLFAWYYGARILILYVFHLNVDSALLNLLTALNSNNLMPKDSIAGLTFAIFGLAFNYGAYLAEVIRGGIESVDPGQIEVSQTLGLSRLQIARYVVLPQALRYMIPPLTNNFITLIQDTAFFQVLGLTELSLRVQDLAQQSSTQLLRWEWYGVELAIYFVLCFSLAIASRRLESRMSHTLAGAH